MNVHWLDFTAIVAAPYLAIVVLMTRLHFRKDGSGNRKQDRNPWEGKGLIFAAAAIVPPAVFIGLGIAHVFIPYGTVLVGVPALLWMAWAIWLQRRAPAAAVRSNEMSAAEQQRALKRGKNVRQMVASAWRQR